MFVDTRLHIAVRPSLEYRLPDAARAVRLVLLGDAPAKEALSALHACVEDDEAYQSNHDASLDDDPRLAALSARVCTHAHEHLQELAAEWRAHLQRTRDAVRRATRDVAARVTEAGAVRARYLARAPRVVEDEYRKERARLARELEDAVAALRDAPVPQCARPPSLTRATDELKEAFAEAYGTAPTPRLMRCKAHFERELARVQRDVANDFVRAVTQLLA